VTKAVADERPGTPLVGDEPADPSDPDPEPDRAPEAAAGDPRTTIAGRYDVDLRTPPTSTGIAVSYQGRDLRTRDPVLVKTLRREYRDDPEMRARFRREARLLQFLSHPNVIRALTFAEERGAPWLVLERVPGRTLREELAVRGPLSPEALVPLLQGMAAALDHLHARGLVHLDLRPENVVLGPGGEVKLVDFGVAQTAGSAQESDGASSPEEIAYLAPEQTCGEPVTTATDVYALGSVVYELLTGQPPFAAPDTPEARNAAIRARLEQPPEPPSAKHAGLPHWVDDVVLGALERDPRLRYGSAGSFAAVFRSGVEGDVDVETGRPRARVEPVRSRQVPLNEPGVAVRGSLRLAARRAEPGAATIAAPEPAVVEGSFTPLPAPKPVVPDRGSRVRGMDLDTLSRRLWQAVIVAAALNVVLVVALLVGRGELPGVWRAAGEVGPGATVRIAGTGLVAREAPATGSAIVADLPDGGDVRIAGEAVPGDGGLWWPIEVDTAEGTVRGFVPESWVHGS
jgi:hypothetical protein